MLRTANILRIIKLYEEKSVPWGIFDFFLKSKCNKWFKWLKPFFELIIKNRLFF